MREIQRKIISELKVEPEIDPKLEIRKSVDFMKAYAKKHTFLNGFVLGISGGQDSTLVGKLAQIAVDELNNEGASTHYQFIGIRLPYGTQFDEEDCEDAIEFIQPSKVYTVNIKEAVDASVRALREIGVVLSDYAKGNEKARERMKVQYSVGAMHDCVVLGSDHAAEAVTGFYTKYGDGGVDLIPLANLTKREVYEWAKVLGVHEDVINRKPSAGLWEGQTDEAEMGTTYDMIDAVVEGNLDKVPQKDREIIERLHRRSEHKRHTAAAPPKF